MRGVGANEAFSVNPTQDEVSQQPLPVWPAVPNVNEVQKKLKEMHAIELVFVDGHELGGVDPFQFRTPKTLPFKSIVHSEPVFDKTICGAEELSQYDAEATEVGVEKLAHCQIDI